MGAPSYNNFRNLITFSRGTNATLFDSTGKLTYGPNNLLTYSQQFENAAWSKNAVTVSADSVVAPDGTTTADTITENSTTDLHVVFATLLSVPTNTAVIFSVYLRANTRNFAMLRIGGGGFTTGPAIKANLTGSGSTSTIEGPVTSSSITAVGGGWYRVSMVFTTISSAPVPNIGPHDNGSSITYAGNGTGSVYAWGAQFEVVTYQTTPSEYIPTVASAVYRPRLDYDPVTLALRGMLVEEQRINLILQSQALETVWTKNQSSITTNAAIAPDGTQSADLWVATTSGNTGTTRLIQSAVVSPSTVYTASIYAKSFGRRWVYFAAPDASSSAYNCWFDLQNGIVGTKGASVTSATITNVGNGWYRLTTTSTATATPNYVFVTSTDADNSLTVTANGVDGLYIWGAQLEAGSFATSYIPTGANPGTRNADLASMSGSQFTPWYNGTQGTLVVRGSSLTAINTSVPAFAAISDGTNSNYMALFSDNSVGRPQFVSFVGAVAQCDLFNAAFSITANTPYAAAAAYQTDNFAMSTNGLSVSTDTSGQVPTVNIFGVGNRHGNSRYLNGHIRSITYYPRRLSNTQLQRLTA